METPKNAMKMIITMLAIAGALIFAPAFALAAQAPVLQAIPDTTIQKNSAAPGIVADLRGYASDGANSADYLVYEITGQTNPGLIDCALDGNYKIACKAPMQDAIGANEITVRVTNSAGMGESDTFSINVIESPTQTGATELTLETSAISIEPAQTTGIGLQIRNGTAARQCYNIAASFGGNSGDIARQIEIRPSQQQGICLNAGEQTGFALTITAQRSALAGTYSANITLASNGTYASRPLSITVVNSGSNIFTGGIGIERTGSYYVCREGLTRKVFLKVMNNTSGTKAITLEAENGLLLPQISPQAINLGPGGSADVQMQISLNDTTATGGYKVVVKAQSATELTEKEIAFGIADCSSTPFTFSLAQSIRAISRGQSASLFARLTSNSDKDQSITLSAESDLPTELGRQTVLLPANGSADFSIRVFARDSDAFGPHDINVYAWSTQSEQKQTARVEITAQHIIGLSVQNNDLTARQGSAAREQAFEATATNNGGYAENIYLTIQNPVAGINIRLSDTAFTLAKGGSRKVYAIIAPAFDARKGNYSATLIARAGGREERLELRFKVIEAAAQAGLGGIEITTFPSEIRLAAGSNKAFSSTITNTGTATLTDVKFSITGLDGGIFVPSQDLGNIEPKKGLNAVDRVYVQQNAVPGTYFGKLTATSGTQAASRDITIKVLTPEEAYDLEISEDNGGNPLSGLFVLLSGRGLFNAGAVILILIAGVIFGTILLRSGKLQ